MVLKDDEWTLGGSGGDGVLPSIHIPVDLHSAVLPAAETLWAWAHVHANRSLGLDPKDILSSDAAVATRLNALLTNDPDLAYSRLICPRRLEPNTAYNAFVIPTFETGRLGGLSLDRSVAPRATTSAWKAYPTRPEPDRFPVYRRWFFHTGAVGDFESLVRLLKPKPVDHRVGVRDMDIQKPGATLSGITDAALQGALKLGGALRVPVRSLDLEEQAAATRDASWFEPYPHAFQTKLARFINLGDDYASVPAAQANAAVVGADPDPVVTPPLYGRWHALTSRLLTDRQGNPVGSPRNWVHELNLDPRYRVPAGFGTRVVQGESENLMAAAWDQVGDVLKANARIRQMQLAQQASLVWHRGDLRPMARRAPAELLSFTAPVHARVIASDRRTLRQRLISSPVHPSLLSGPARRALRPRGPLLRAASTTLRMSSIVERVNSGELVPVPPKVSPSGLPGLSALATALLPSGAPAWLIEALQRWPFLAMALIIVALVLAVLAIALGIGLVAIVLAAFAAWIARIESKVRRADALDASGLTPRAIQDLKHSPNFQITPAGPGGAITFGATDSQEGTRFKNALTDVANLIAAGRAADKVGENGPARRPLDLTTESELVMRSIDPSMTIPRHAQTVLQIPQRLRDERPDPLSEAWAYPVFDTPMYKPLAGGSAELLLPNINRIEHDSVTLLEVNQKFIEAYMVGLNHEFARELLWREYPTDQRGSYFRQFWDVSSLLTDPNADQAALREKLRDIPPLHRWNRSSTLGTHDQRATSGTGAADLVLVVRGELLRRYPRAAVYAQAAEWEQTNGEPDAAKPRRLVTIADDEEDNPPQAKLRTPLYGAKVDPDIFFFGFDLTIGEARGGDAPPASPGWFFVLKQRPGEPRFGFQEKSEDQIVIWDDVGWDRVVMSVDLLTPANPNIVIPNATPPAEFDDKDAQRQDDRQVSWNDNVSAAELAYVLFQAPAMVAVHAAEMLPHA